MTFDHCVKLEMIEEIFLVSIQNMLVIADAVQIKSELIREYNARAKVWIQGESIHESSTVLLVICRKQSLNQVAYLSSVFVS